MRKLRLEIEKLRVESFTADEARAARGTVAARGPTVPQPGDPVPVPTAVLCTPGCADSVEICNVSIAQSCFTQYGNVCGPTPWTDC